MKVGYGRVSTTGQSLELQQQKLEQVGCERIYMEKKSGSTQAGRVELKQALAFCREGDVLVVTKLDRLARSLNDLLTITKTLEQKNVGLIILDQNIDTTTPQGKLMFQMVGAFGEFERALINERAAEGREKAKQQGVKFGRKPTLSDEKVESLKEAFNRGVDKKELMQEYGISRATMYRLVKDS